MSVYSAPWYTPAVQRLLDLALEEDVGRGDVTTPAVIDETQEAEAEIVARERAVVCGLGVVEAVFTRFDWRTRVRMKVADGDPIAPGGVVASVRGPAAALLAGERTALNFLQHLSGIATLTQAYVAAAEGAKIRVTDTRKTTPGLRALEKYAVRVGGGANHRADLASGILIKDNHVALVGSVREAVRRARANAPARAARRGRGRRPGAARRGAGGGRRRDPARQLPGRATWPRRSSACASGARRS